MDNSSRNIIESAINKAKSIGANHVDVMFSESQTISASTRLAKLEKLVQANLMSVDMRVSVGNHYASISSDNIEQLKDDSFIEKVVSSAKNSPEEKLKIRADSNELCKNFKEIDICDKNFEANPDYFVNKAKECEDVALQIKGITNSEGAEAGYSRTKFTLMRDDGFCASYEKTLNQISIVTLAEKNGNLEQDYAYSTTIYSEDLRSSEEIAKEAAEKTLRRLGARKIQSCKVPVVFDRRTSRQLLNSMLDALSGSAVARGISFLKDKLSQKVFADCINVTDKYAINRGLRSRPFDSDGLECRDTNIVTNGTINSFLLNTKYASKMNMKSTANASSWEGISPNNVFIENGSKSFSDLIKGIKSGLFVTDVMGNGVNMVTGNYSQGTAGFWIENGEIAYPVNEITVAGNFLEMFSHCDIASDLKLEFGIDSPSIFFEEMIVGGI